MTNTNVKLPGCIKNNVKSYIVDREIGLSRRWNRHPSEVFVSRRLPFCLKEREISLGEVNKIFTAKWLDNNHVICGTKCNKLIAINVDIPKQWTIPMLEGSKTRPMIPLRNCGIHSISINPASTALVTGGARTNDIAVYSLPSLQPICVGEFHRDWIFSAAWIDDQVFASGSRDGSIAIWSIKDLEKSPRMNKSYLYPQIQPIKIQQRIPTVNRIRDMLYNTYEKKLAAISSDGYFHAWDTETLQMISSVVLPYNKENVCLVQERNNLFYAIGSMSHVSLHDTRDGNSIGSICTQRKGDGVRSISFRELVITIGTGVGTISFYDLRMQKYLSTYSENRNSACVLKAGKGWLCHNDVYREHFWDENACTNAIFTHCYDPTLTRLFTAGGPQAIGLQGNYSAVWE